MLEGAWSEEREPKQLLAMDILLLWSVPCKKKYRQTALWIVTTTTPEGLPVCRCEQAAIYTPAFDVCSIQRTKLEMVFHRPDQVSAEEGMEERHE